MNGLCDRDPGWDMDERAIHEKGCIQRGKGVPAISGGVGEVGLKPSGFSRQSGGQAAHLDACFEWQEPRKTPGEMAIDEDQPMAGAICKRKLVEGILAPPR